MPGLVLVDFGDLVRSLTISTAHGSKALKTVCMRLPMFEAGLRGYWSAAQTFLGSDETSHLVVSAQVITYELAVRYLTDFLNGDIYFRTARPQHNLDRARVQLRLLASMQVQEGEMHRVVRTVTGF
jgi:hypothetical protein